MKSLILRNLFFTLLQPGIVAGVVPYYMVRNKWDQVIQNYGTIDAVGTVVFLTGFVIMTICIIQFATQGNGTLSPADPTKKLVIKGLYKYSRNPMYVGVTLMLLGESIVFQVRSLWTYSIIIWTAFFLFVIFFEEVRLRTDFGAEYDQYCKKVRRWL